jgi:hypothetical protein
MGLERTLNEVDRRHRAEVAAKQEVKKKKTHEKKRKAQGTRHTSHSKAPNLPPPP